MSIKLDVSQNLKNLTLTPLSAGGVVSLNGRDAIAFAQSQFANDVHLLRDGEWQWNLWLSAKGRVNALFALIRLNAESLVLWLPDAAPDSLQTELQRYRFRSKVSIETVSTDSAGTFMRSGAAAANQAQVLYDDDGLWQHILLDMGGSQPRSLVIERSESPQIIEPDFDAQWRLFDIQHGLPRLSPQYVEAFTPHMLSLDRLRAFSVKKGCYPGQEIVARTHFLGQSKRGLVRFSIQDELQIGEHLTQETNAKIEAICVEKSTTGSEFLCVTNLADITTPYKNTKGAIAAPLDLLEGLAR